MKRRDVLLAGLLASTALSSAKAESKVELIYVSGWDCPYCITWKKKYKEGWLASPEFKRVTYVEVDVPHLKEAYQERYWKGELKATLAQIPKKSGTPRWLVVKDGQIVSNQFGGEDTWLTVYEDIKKALT